MCTKLKNIPFFLIRTFNFKDEAESSYKFLHCEAENVFKMFLNLRGVVFQEINSYMTRKPIKLLALMVLK